MRRIAALPLLAALVLSSCATTGKGQKENGSIVDRFKRETGFSLREEVRAVEYFRNEIAPNASITKYALFLSENDTNSVLAQKPPFSPEWTRGEFSSDYRGEWLNAQRAELSPYAELFKAAGTLPKPGAVKGYVSRTGSLRSGDKTLKILFVNELDRVILYYVLTNG